MNREWRESVSRCSGSALVRSAPCLSRMEMPALLWLSLRGGSRKIGAGGLCKRRKAGRAAAAPGQRTERERDARDGVFASGRKVISRVGRKSGRVYPSGRFQDRPRACILFLGFLGRLSVADKPSRCSRKTGTFFSFLLIHPPPPR